MTHKNFFLVTGIIFAIVALAHLLRLVQGWDITVGSYVAPMWLSWLGLIIPGFLAYEGFHFGTRE